MYFNCRSLLPKFEELAALCLATKPDIVCPVETRLSSDVLDSEVSIQNYFLVRHDRNRPGDCVAIHKHNSISYNVLLHGSDSELLIVSLSKSSCKCMFCLGVFYTLPSSLSVIFDHLRNFTVRESI